jgi:2-C-methyl-D-erythritol 4-phosphate cytidylyltransferase
MNVGIILAAGMSTRFNSQVPKQLFETRIEKIRTKTEEIISLVMPILGYQEFLNATKDK